MIFHIKIGVIEADIYPYIFSFSLSLLLFRIYTPVFNKLIRR